MDFGGDIARWQRRGNECAEGVSRRRTVLEALAPQLGHRVLDAGCGGGHLAREIANAVGSNGEVLGIDLSDNQVNAARAFCADVPTISIEKADVTGLLLPDASFDGVTSIQVLEYVADVKVALSEIGRVLKPGTTAVLVSMLWDTYRFAGAEKGLNERIHEAWRAHCPHQMLPACLPALLKETGFRGISQKPILSYNTMRTEDFQGYWSSLLVASFAVDQGVSEDDARKWLDQLDKAAAENRYCFVTTPVVTVATCI